MRGLSKSVLGRFAALKAQWYAAVSIPPVSAVDFRDPAGETSCSNPTGAGTDNREQSPYAIRSLDDYAGRLTGNGLGSLDIGGGRSPFHE